MMKEAPDQLGLVLQAAEFTPGVRFQLIDRVRHEILHGRLHHGVTFLFGVEFGGITGQHLDGKVSGVRGQEGQGSLGMMCGQPVPDDQQGAAQAATKVFQCTDEALAVDSTTEMPGREPPFGGNDHDTGDHTALGEALEDRALGAARPGVARARDEAVPRLVQEDNLAMLPARFFLSSTHSSCGQRAMRSSSRSRARGKGSWTVKPCALSGRARWRG